MNQLFVAGAANKVSEMQFAVDWVSMGIFAVGFGFTLVRSIPIKLRHLIMAAAFAGIVAYRYLNNVQPQLFTAVAGVFMAIALFRALTSRGRPQVQHGDDDE
jgi:hypothetical protein